MDRICLFFAGPLSLGAVDQLVDDGHGGKTVNDDYRIAYLRDHIREMGEAIEDGVELWKDIRKRASTGIKM